MPVETAGNIPAVAWRAGSGFAATAVGRAQELCSRCLERSRHRLTRLCGSIDDRYRRAAAIQLGRPQVTPSNRCRTSAVRRPNSRFRLLAGAQAHQDWLFAVSHCRQLWGRRRRRAAEDQLRFLQAESAGLHVGHVQARRAPTASNHADFERPNTVCMSRLRERRWISPERSLERQPPRVLFVLPAPARPPYRR